jgi:hypothetical protein
MAAVDCQRMRVLLLLLLVPSVAAQSFEPSFTMEGPGRIEVGVNEQASLTLAWSFVFRESSSAALAFPARDVHLQWDPPICSDAGIALTGPLTQVIRLESPVRTSYTGEITFAVSADATAEGEVPIECTLRGRSLAVNEAVKESALSEIAAQVKVRYFGVLQVVVASRVVEASPGTDLSYGLEVKNFGNAATLVTVVPATASHDFVLPEPVVVPRNGTADLEIHVRTSASGLWTNSEAFYAFTVKGTSPVTNTESQPVELTLQGRVRGLSAATPQSIILVLGLLAIGGTAWYVRKKGE